MNKEEITWNTIDKIIIKGPVPLMSVTNSKMKYEKLIAKARTVKISNTFVIGG